MTKAEPTADNTVCDHDISPAPLNDSGACAKTITREELLAGAVSIFAATWSAMTLFPLYLYLKPSGKTDEGTKVQSVVVGAASEIPPGTGKNFKFGSTPAVITHTKDGEFHAFSAICSHLGCTVQFREDRQQIWCACHGGCYDPSTGKNVSGPPPKPLKTLKATLKDGKIVVSRV